MLNIGRNIKLESVAKFIKNMQSIRKKIEAVLHKAAEDMVRYSN